jgi:hypothetical protein
MDELSPWRPEAAAVAITVAFAAAVVAVVATAGGLAAAVAAGGCCILALQSLRPVEIGTFSTYLHAHRPKINSSPVKILKSSWKVPGKFLESSWKVLKTRSQKKSQLLEAP